MNSDDGKPGVETWISARKRLAGSAVAGVTIAAVSAVFFDWQVSVLLGWLAVSGTLMGLLWAAVLKADAERTRAIARREDETRLVSDLVALAASVASLVGVALILVKASKASGWPEALMTVLGVASIAQAWALVHSVYTLRYADLYYRNDSGIDFNDDDPPDYRDFAYLAFTIGMTYQVSDTDLQTKTIRRTALKHALLCSLFGVAIIAVTINLLAGLVS